MIRQGIYTKKVSRLTRAKRGVRRRWLWFKGLSKKKKALLISAPILAFLILTPLITYAYYYNDIADQERLMNRNNTGVILTDKNGKAFYSIGRAAHRNMVPLSQISDNMKHALVASEDKDFYKHDGFSITGIVRSLFNNVSSGSITGGGSTITQQLAKTTLLSEQQTILRKYQELTVSIAIEQRYSKDEILDMYLNSVFFGGTNFGIEEAAKFYFNKEPKDLDLAESAMLVGILPAPNVYSPTLGSLKYAKARQKTVLTRMVTNGYITKDQKDAALGEQLAYAEPKEQDQGDAPHFAQMVMSELYEKYGGSEKVLRSGYQVKTTLDLGLQKTLEANIAAHMPYIQQNGGSNASGVAIDPTSGGIRALAGSADWNNQDWGKVNMVTTARQPGSSFKSIYYAEALAQGVITPATILHDVATDFNGYKPMDADRLFRGNVTARSAISQSLNIPSVEVMQKLGIDKAVQAANRMGISAVDANKNYGLSLALGSAEVPLLQMTNAYAAFANQGTQYTPTMIEKIANKFNKTIFTAHEKGNDVISSEGAFLISNILSDNNARAPIFSSSLTVPGHTAAVKTGTTDEQRDAWTIGYTPQLAVGVWVGNNDNAAMLNGGSGMAGPIWVATMQQALQGVQDTPFAAPSGVIQKPVCYGTGALAETTGTNTYNEYFLASALPTETCNAAQQAPPQQSNNKTDTSDTDNKKDTKTPSSDGDSGDGSDDNNKGSDPGDGSNDDNSDPGNDGDNGGDNNSGDGSDGGDNSGSGDGSGTP
jgi:1A family penicillin-binding protein